MRALLLIFILTPLLSLAKTGGPEDAYYILEDFDNHWLIYDQETQDFLPFTRKESSDNPAHSVILRPSLFKGYTLLVKSDNQTGQLLINNTIFKSLPKDTWISIPVDEIPMKEDKVLLTFYGSTNLNHKSLMIGSLIKNSETASTLPKSRLGIIKLRPFKPSENAFVVAFLILLSFSTIVSSTNPKAFNEYFELSDLLTTKIRETRFLISKPMNRVNLAFISLLSLMTGFIYILLAGDGIVLFSSFLPLNFENAGAGYYLLIFTLATLVSFLLYLGKFFMLAICGQLFGLGKTTNLHFYKNIQFLLFSFLLLSIGLYAFTTQHVLSKENLGMSIPIILIIIYSGRVILSFFSILKNHNIQYLFLIAYLCVVEVLPTIIGFRLAF